MSTVKVMANQFHDIATCLSTTDNNTFGDVFPSFANAFRESNFAWLKRRDVVSQAISRFISRQTGINNATGSTDDMHFAGNLAKGYDPSYSTEVVYRYGAILQQVTAITLENLVWHHFFSTHSIKLVQNMYEEVILDEGKNVVEVSPVLPCIHCARCTGNGK